MTTLTEFLLARIAEDEREAQVMMRQYEAGGDVSSRRWRRVLAECEAKRQIAYRHAACDDTSYGEPCDDLRDLAVVYADHPDYREEWRP